MSKITYENKEALNQNPNIPDRNKVNDTDMNMIKNVVNNNETKVLLAVSSSAPATCDTGDIYFNTTDNLIYTATTTNTWSTTGIAPTKNTIYIEFTNQTAYAYDGTTLVSVGGGAGGGDSAPIGQVSMYAGSTAPDGFLMCDGSAVSREIYKDLYRVIGTTYGTGDGSTTFNLPNIKGKVVVMLDSNDTDFDTLGETGGSKYLQAHRHGLAQVNDSGDGGYGSMTTLGFASVGWNDKYNALEYGTANVGTGNSGNLQPYIVLNYIIKATKVTPTQAQVVNTYSESTQDTYSCDYVNGKVLYENASGTMGNVTLSDSVANYTKITILYRNGDGYSGTIDVLNPNGQTTSLILSYYNSGTSKFMNWSGTIEINGTIITHTIDYYYENSQGSLTAPQTINYISILKVIGYK